MSGVRLKRFRRGPSHYRWQSDSDYCEAFDRAKHEAADRLEDEAWRRAVEGVEEPVGWYKGKQGGVVHRYSDTLLIFLMKGLMPERYGDRVEVGGTLANLDVSRLPDDLVERIAAGEHPLAVLASATSELMER